jgi:hypothetical protein
MNKHHSKIQIKLYYSISYKLYATINIQKSLREIWLISYVMVRFKQFLCVAIPHLILGLNNHPDDLALP